MVEVSGYAGYEWRGEPDGFDMPGGAFRWGAGAGLPVAESAAGHTELNGLLVVGRRRRAGRRR